MTQCSLSFPVADMIVLRHVVRGWEGIFLAIFFPRFFTCSFLTVCMLEYVYVQAVKSRPSSPSNNHSAQQKTKTLFGRRQKFELLFLFLINFLFNVKFAFLGQLCCW